jgi:peptide/nickel transport system permease protein/oligopeptide transport system permease protein
MKNNKNGITRRSPVYLAFQRFWDNKAAVFSALILVILVLMAIFAPLITPARYDQQIYLERTLAFPSKENWFGVDAVGRDFYSRIIYGARVSLGIGVTSALVSLLIGLPLGTLAGYKGGKTDWVVMRLVEIFSVIPPLLVAILIAALMGGGVINVILISSAFGSRTGNGVQETGIHYGCQSAGSTASIPDNTTPVAQQYFADHCRFCADNSQGYDD